MQFGDGLIRQAANNWAVMLWQPYSHNMDRVTQIVTL
jgi:hypothetical protein